MTRRASLQATYTKGELDPDLSERNDLEAYYDSLASAANSLFHPQGGFSDRGGFELCSDADILASGVERRLRNRIVPIDLSADNLTALNGGLTSSLVDQDATTQFTTNAMTAAPFSIVEIDLGGPQRVDFVDLQSFGAELAGADECLAVEYYDGASWITFADAIGVPAAKHIRTSLRTRRFGVTPGGPGGVPVLARQWRIVARTGENVIGQISIGGLRMWAETSALAPKHCREVGRDQATTYELVIGERNIDVFQRQRYVASIPLPVAAQQVGELWFAGGFDTMFVFHEMVESPRVQRQGSSGEWNVDAIPYVNVPSLVEQVVFSGDQDEVQDISFAGLAAGASVVLFLGDLVTAQILIGAAADLPALVKEALQALPGVATAASDMTVELVDAASLTVRVRFAGDNGSRAWPLIAPVAMSGAAVPDTVIVQPGLDASGTYMSAETGWPTCGVLTNQRMMVCGFRAAPTSYRFSRVPDLYDFLPTGDPLTPDLGFGGALDVKSVERIIGVYVGTHLTLFTPVREYFSTAPRLDATAPAAFLSTTANGAARGVPITTVDGQTLFVQAGGNTLRELAYTEDGKGYTGDPVTVLSPHILTGVVDVACRQARRVEDGNQLFLVNEDGSAGVMTLLKSQKVVAGSPWSTYGNGFRSMMVSLTHEVYAIVERDGSHWLERWTPEWPLDWATHAVGEARTLITGADYLEGRSDVWVIADAELIGPVTVTDGAFELDTPATDVRFGLAPEWGVRSQVVREKLANSQPFRGPGRIYEMEIALKRTGTLELATNGGPWNEVPVLSLDGGFQRGGPLQAGGDPQLPMFERLYTGNVLMTGLLGIAEYPYWALRRAVPAPVHIKSVRQEIAHRGDQFAGGG